MAQFVVMPQQGSTMEEGTILRWLKKEGDAVKAGEPLLEIETDKATMEVEAPEAGVLRKILAAESDLVPIRTPIAIVGTADESLDALLGQAGLVPASAPVASAPTAAPTPVVSATPVPVLANGGATSAAEIFVSPRARRLADEHGVVVSALAGQGTGPEGRIIERDILAYVEARQAVPAPTVETAERSSQRVTPLAARIADDLGVNLSDLAAGLPGSRVRSEDVLRHAETRRPAEELAPVAAKAAPPAEVDYTVQTFAGMRKRIAENVSKSAFSAPHVTLTLEVDMTACVEFRTRVLPDVEKAYGVRLSYTDILIKAVARALGEYPMLNAALVGEEVRLYKNANIGVAVALDEGLIVPVLRNADTKSLGAVSAELKQLVERARTGKFTPDDLSGGTFSITNLGAFGIDVFDPIIVPPQAAILGVCRIAEKPIVLKGEVVVRSMMNLCLSFDHRILDGAPAARFLQRLKELLESPMLVLL